MQIDEPVMVRFPQKALSYGIDNLEKCFADVSEGTTKVVHLCCGYPLYLVSFNLKEKVEGFFKSYSDKYLVALPIYKYQYYSQVI